VDLLPRHSTDSTGGDAMNSDQEDLLRELETGPVEPLARVEIMLVGSCLAVGTLLLVVLACLL
jgi:hypothetical protein